MGEARDPLTAARARSFGAQAELYDRARPSYPRALVDALLAEPAPRVLDVGCGTGIASRLFAERGCSVLGVEHDGEMAHVARSHGIEVEVAPFEEWDPAGRRFDLAICAQAWHWIDHAEAAPIAARALSPKGRFSAFWNFGRPVGDAAAAADSVYGRVAPQLRAGTPGSGNFGEDAAAAASVLLASGLFGELELLSFPWEATYTTHEYVEQLRTHSDHALLSDAVREQLLGEIAAALDAHGGSIDVRYATRGFVARVTP